MMVMFQRQRLLAAGALFMCVFTVADAFSQYSWQSQAHQQRTSTTPLHLQRSLPSSLLPLRISEQPRRRRRKRDYLARFQRNLLSMRSSDSDDDNKEEEFSLSNEKNSTSSSLGSTNVTATTTANATTAIAAFLQNNAQITKETVQAALAAVLAWMARIKWQVASFVAGIVVAGAALLVPIYTQVQTLTQPVTLFETILADLDSGYVDPVDTNRLFETGVKAMLSSLDPYTEFEGKEEAVAMTESIEGRYGGVGLVISGTTTPLSKKSSTNANMKPAVAPISDNKATTPETGGGGTTTDPLKKNADPSKPFPDGVPVASTADLPSSAVLDDDEEDYLDYMALDDEDDEEDVSTLQQQRKQRQAAAAKGIRVVSAFEGYAFDYGMRVGDKLVAVDDTPILAGRTTVEQVRNQLRGPPGTLVTIRFERDGVPGVQSVTMPRSVVRVRDVKVATLLGNPADGVGYIQLSGFAADTGSQVRQAIQYLQRAAEDATAGERPLQGLVLDLRGNPGGLLTSAVDVCSLLVPKGSDIVSAKGRGFPGILYRSRVDPILDTSQTKLAVLVNGQTASAAEIVSGAIQDLDVGVVIGSDRTFGKGLVQNVESLPFDTALKFTVAKYYTPSGRCIQGVNYKQLDDATVGRDKNSNNKYVASKVAEKDRATFYTRSGRVVRDGGGIEADFKVPAPKASALEVTLLRSGVLNEFAAEWSKTNELTNNFEVDEDTYKKFQTFVTEKQRRGELELESLYSKPLSDLKRSLKLSGYIGAEKSVEQLQARIVRDIQSDFQKYRNDIKEDISQNILARYLPESMLVERGAKNDVQVQAAIKLLSNDQQFDKLLARGSSSDTASSPGAGGNTLNMASGSGRGGPTESSGARGKIEW